MNIIINLNTYDTKKTNYYNNENNILIISENKNYNIKKSKNAQYKVNKSKNVLNLILQLNLVYGENRIDNIIYSQLLLSHKNLISEIENNLKNKVQNSIMIEYEDLDKIFSNLSSYYYYNEKILITEEFFIIIHKNKYVELKNIKNIINDLELVKQLGIIILDNSKLWLENINNSLKYKKKIIISDNYYDIKNNYLNYCKFSNFREKIKEPYDLIIIDSENINMNQIKNVMDQVRYLNINYILRISKDDNFGIEIFYYLFNNKLTLPIVNEKLTQEIQPFFFRMKKNDKMNINSLIKIERIYYQVTPNEKNLINCIKINSNNNKKIDYLDYLDSLSLSFYKTFKEINNNQCPICMELLNDITCVTNCEHYFCMSCLSLSLLSSKSCPLCRQKINMNKIKTRGFNYFSKIKIFEDNIDKIHNEKSVDTNILVYINNNNIAKFIFDRIRYKYKTYYLNGNNKSKIKKIDKINKDNNIIIILNSKDFSYAKSLYNINTIIILDHKYNYILNKESLGYNCINNKQPVNIIIYEMEQ